MGRLPKIYPVDNNNPKFSLRAKRGNLPFFFLTFQSKLYILVYTYLGGEHIKKLILIFIYLFLTFPCQAGIIYVDAGAGGANNGSSWADAYNYLQDALTTASAGSEIWVAQGTYQPDVNTAHPDGNDSRYETFQLKNGVAIYGGFPTGGGSRDPNTYTTILSGDINVPNDNNDNSYHVVTGLGIDSTAVLDGFTITAGDANGGSTNRHGGGMYNSSGSPTVINCIFSGNSSANYGGGMYNYGYPNIINCTFRGNDAYNGGGMFNYIYCSPTLTNCTFSGNSATYCGGGIHTHEFSSPTLNYCTFSGNSAYHGGGIYDYNSSPTVTNCTFNSNTTTNDGAGMYNYYGSPTIINCIFSGNEVCLPEGTSWGGGMFNNHSSPTLTNCKFIGNSVDDAGGGMFNYIGSPTLTNCTFIGNSVNDTGGGMYNHIGNPILTNCIFIGNLADYGGGMLNFGNNPTITNCTFIENSAGLQGGGMRNFTSSPTVANCTFSGNSSNSGGGMYNTVSSSPTVTNCTFTGNNSTVSGGGMFNYSSSNPIVTNCILWGNTAPIGPQIYNDETSSATATIWFSDVQGGYSGTGNINADPCFVTGPDANYYLSQITAGQAGDSPCVDAGSDTAANLGMDVFTTRTDQLPDIGTVDMGYHYSCTILIGSADIDRNWHVDFLDFAILAADWLECSNPYDANCTETGLLAGDIIADYHVNMDDLAILTDCWLDCYVTKATGPEPSDGADGVDPNIVLAWSPGDGAMSHDVYCGMDLNEVNDADIDDANIFMGNYDVNYWDSNSYDSNGLDLRTTYYWRIDEVGPACTAKGDIWSFMTTCVPFDPNLDLVSWWKFDEGSGTIAYDSAGDNDGTLVNGPVWTTGQIDGALNFDGEDDYVDLGNDSSLKPPLPVTVSAWIKLDTLGKDNGILSLDKPFPTHYGILFSVEFNNNRLRILYGDGGGAGISHKRNKVGTTSLVADKWYHVAAVVRGPTDMDLYIDAVNDGETYSGTGGSLAYSTEHAFIGCNTNDSFYQSWFHGKIDNVRVYDRALVAEEIEQLYQEGLE